MTDTLLDSTLRREAQLLRFGTYLKSEYIIPSSQRLSIDIPKLMVGYSELNKAERNALTTEIARLVKSNMSDMFTDITKELEGVVVDEIAFTDELYEDFTGETFAAVKGSTAISAANNAIMSLEGGATVATGVWSDFVEQNINTAMRSVNGVVLKGFRDGSTLQQITQELRGTYNRSTKKYMGGVLNNTNAKRAETLARTGVSHYANSARNSFAQKNKKLIPESVFFATLDNRTTTTCLSLHLNRYSNEDPNKPTLPIHYNERSIYLFAGEGIDPTEGTRPIIGGRKGVADEFEARQSRTSKKVSYKGKASLDVFEVDSVTAKMTSQQFLERQPMWFVESTLGKTRAKLFKEGGLKIEKFTDLQGNQLTLAELRETAAGEAAYRRLEG